MELQVIASIRTDFQTKFGIPRQSGLAETKAEIIFEPEFASEEAVRGLEGYSHIWLIWEFSENAGKPYHPTVRPPRLGGNTRVGVFATRSPFRPNPIGLSSVRLDAVENREGMGPVLHVSGADLMDGTPIYDIKPYIPYADCHPDAKGGFTDTTERKTLRVTYAPDAFSKAADMTEEQIRVLKQVLAQDPRPSYQKDPERVYGMAYGGYEVKFRVAGECLTVLSVMPEQH